VGKLQIVVDEEPAAKSLSDHTLSPAVVQGKSIWSWDYQLLSVDQSVPEEPTVAAVVDNLAAGVEADPRFGPVYTDIIAQASIDLPKPLGEGLIKDNALGNLISDAFRNRTGTDIAIQPQGFISQTIYQGAVKGADIFQAVPYGFDETSGLGLKLITFETDGISLISGLEFSVYNLPPVEDFFLHGSNLSYVYNLANSPGSRVEYSTIMINGAPLDPAATYSVTVPDAVVPFLSEIPGFQVNNLQETDLFVYEVVRDFMMANSPVAFYAEGRVIDLMWLEEPLVGVSALADVVNLFEENGSIERSSVAEGLRRQLDRARRHLEGDRYQQAAQAVEFFQTRVRFLTSLGAISSWSSERLIYLAEQLTESIPGAFTKLAEAESEQTLPRGFQLFQNYPNPFNPETHISYSLSEGTDVRLAIYNVLGQEIKVLVDGYQNAGSNTVVWDGRNQKGERVSSGIYFYKLQAGEIVQTRKMSLMK
jgi:hypothetical protein